MTADENLLKDFISFEKSQIKTVRGGKEMYDVKGYYKYIDRSELFKYFIERYKG